MNKLSNLFRPLKERLNKVTRLWVVEVLLLLAFGIIAARLVYLHAGPNEAQVQKAQDASGYTKTIPPYRGRILDGSRNPNILALSLAVYDVCANPEKLALSTNVDAAAGILSAYLKIPREGIRERLSHSERKFAFIKRFVNRDVGERIMIQMTNNHIIKGGVYLVDSTIRSYPQNSQACHVVGFVNHEGAGSLGVEMAQNNSLTGTPGVVIGMKDGKKHEIYTRRIEEIKPRPGSDVYLTLDQQIQYFAERALDEAMAEHSAKAAWAIVQRCRTGEILAMASRPAFDLNEFGAEPDMHRMTNRAVSVNYEPGSTLKPVTLALAFTEGIVTPDTMFDCENGSWFHMGRVLHDYHPYPRLSVADIIKKSSNIGTAKIALMLGDEKLFKGMRAFGFGVRAGIDLPYEEGGILPRLERWSGLSCSRIAIGQGVAVTSLQMAGMMSAIANDGFLLKPYVIKSIVDANGLIRASGQPVVVSRPIDAKVAALMRYLLARVTEEGGTGTRARVEGFKVAGKTGTAQKTVPGGYSDTAYMASFAGFLPADKPEITIVVVVEEPQPYHTGGVVAAPVFAKIAEQTVRYLNLEPTERVEGAAGHAAPAAH